MEGTQVASLFGVLSLKDELTPALEKSKGALSSFGSAFGDLSKGLRDFGKEATVGLTLPIIAGLGLAVKAASDEQSALAQLNNELIATANKSGTAAAATGHWATTAEATGPKADKMRNSLEMLTAQLSQHEAQLGRTKGPHDVLNVQIDQEKEKIAQLTTALGINTSGHKVWIAAQTEAAGVTHMTEEALVKMAESYAQTTRFSKDTVISGEALMLTFTNVGKDVFPSATQAALDMSTAMGQDLNSTVLQLGKALNDPIKGYTALQRMGVTFDDQQKAQMKTMERSGDIMGAQTIIIKELEREFGGAAAAAGDTFAGQMDIAKHASEGLLVAIGNQLLPVLTGLMTGLASLVNQITSSLSPGMIQAGIVLALFVAAIGPIATILGSIGLAIGFVLSPIGLVALAVGGLALAFATNFGGIRSTIESAWNAVQPTIQKFIDIGKGIMTTLTTDTSQTSLINVKGNRAGQGGQRTDDDGNAIGMGAAQTKMVTSDATPDFVSKLIKALGEAAPKVTDAITGLLRDVGTWITTTGLPKVKNTLQELFNIPYTFWDDPIGNLFKGATNWLSTNGPNILKSAISIALDIGKALKDALPGAAASLANFFDTLLNGTGASSDGKGRGSAQGKGGLLDLVKQMVDSATNWLSTDGVKLIGDAITALFNMPKKEGDAVLSFIPIVQPYVEGGIDWINNTGAVEFGKAVRSMFDLKNILSLGGPSASDVADISKTLKDTMSFGDKFKDDGRPKTGANSNDNPFLTKIQTMVYDTERWILGEGATLYKNALAGFFGVDSKVMNAAVASFMGPIRAAVKSLAKFLSDIGIASPLLSPLLGIAAKLADIAGMASGGPVAGGTPYIVGERGPELFVPGSSGNIVPNDVLSGGARSSGSGGQNVININNPTFNGVNDVQALYAQLEREAGRRNMVLGVHA